MIRAAAFGGLSAILHGCGGSGDAPDGPTTAAPATSGASTISPVSSTSAAPSTSTHPALSLVDLLNEQYMGFNPNDSDSPLGVVIQMHDDFVFFCGTPCFNGNADCRVSTSVYNHLVMVDHSTGGPAITMGRQSGIVFNHTSVSKSLAKCSYQFDGATFNRLNGGCGCGAGPQDCNDPHSAYWNVDPETCKDPHDFPDSCQNATGSSPHVTRCHCEVAAWDPTNTTDEQCFWSGAALGGDNVAADETRKMLLQRVRNAVGTEQVGAETRYKNEYWNEIVVDGKVLEAMLQDEPTSAILAMVYILGSADGKAAAMSMSQDMAKKYGMATPVPVIAIDASVNVSATAPFLMEGDGPQPSPTPSPAPSPGPSPEPTGTCCPGLSCCATGVCCPMADGTMLGCCGAAPVATTTAAATTTTTTPAASSGCCPTKDGAFLGCCDEGCCPKKDGFFLSCCDAALTV